MRKYIPITILTLSLSGCIPLPALFGGAAISGAVVAAKDEKAGDKFEDIKISAGIKKTFIAKGFRDLYTKISVNVTEGRVLYTGSVAKEEDIIMALDIAWEQNGVKEVINELQVSDQSGYFESAEYSRDAWITSRIKAQTLINRDIKFVNYNIITSKGIVYILGIARTQEELDKVASIASEIAGVKKVVVQARVKENT